MHDGWHCLHLYYRVCPTALAQLNDSQRSAGREELLRLLDPARPGAPQRVQTADQIATVLGELELFGLGRDEVDEFFARVDAVTLQQANDVVKRYYRTENLTFVLLGNASKVRSIAAKYGPNVVERTTKQPGWAGM